MKSYRAVIILAVIAILSSVVTGCSPASPATPSTPPSVPSSTQQPAAPSQPASPPATPPSQGTVPSPTTTTSFVTTAGQLADAGSAEYAKNCAMCHGTDGQGGGKSALTGPNANPAKYTNAQKLFEFISTQMPPGKAGSLTKEVYLQIVSFLLLKNGFVQASANLDEKGLENIKLTK